MFIKPRQFPHPVLSDFSDDLVGCDFQASLLPSVTSSTYNFNASFITSCSDLQSLIAAGKGCYAVHIECAKTRYRTLHKSHAEVFSFSIPAARLDGTVELSSFILAEDNIDGYTSRFFHSDYAGANFRIMRGDILAVAENKSFEADKQIEEIKNIPSIFSIQPNKNEEAPPLDVGLGTHKIVIFLSEDNFSRYQLLKGNRDMSPLFFQMLIMPALVFVLEILKKKTDEVEDFDDKRWYKVLSKKLAEAGYKITDLDDNPDSSVQIAQKLVGEPLRLSLKALEDISTGYSVEGDE